jgi:hypothetical protein
MDVATIRGKLHELIEQLEDKKIRALYTLLENQMEGEVVEYSAEFKKDLDRRYGYYKRGGEMVSAVKASRTISKTSKSKARK